MKKTLNLKGCVWINQTKKMQCKVIISTQTRVWHWETGFELFMFISRDGALVLGCSMPKLGWGGVGFLRWGDMGDTSAPPQPNQKRPFSAISTSGSSRAFSSGSNPGRPLLFTSQSGLGVCFQPTLVTSPITLANCLLEFSIARFCSRLCWVTLQWIADNVLWVIFSAAASLSVPQLNLSFVLIGKPPNHLGANPFADRSLCWSLFVDRSLCWPLFVDRSLCWPTNTVVPSFVSATNCAVLTF